MAHGAVRAGDGLHLDGAVGWGVRAVRQRGHLVQVLEQVAHRRGRAVPSTAGYGDTTGRPESPYSIVRTPAETGPPSPETRCSVRPGSSVSTSGSAAIAAAASGPAVSTSCRSRPSIANRTVSSAASRQSIAVRTAIASASQPNDDATTPCRAAGDREHSRLGSRAAAWAQQPRLEQVRVAHHPQPVGAHAAEPVTGVVEDLGELARRGVRRGDPGRPATDVDDLRVLVNRHVSPGRSTRASRDGPAPVARTGRAARRSGPAARWPPARPAGPARQRPAPSPSARSRRSAP